MDDIERCSVEKFIPAKITTNTQNTSCRLAEAEQNAILFIVCPCVVAFKVARYVLFNDAMIAVRRAPVAMMIIMSLGGYCYVVVER